jgi:hypothetical protein
MDGELCLLPLPIGTLFFMIYNDLVEIGHAQGFVPVFEETSQGTLIAK